MTSDTSTVVSQRGTANGELADARFVDAGRDIEIKVDRGRSLKPIWPSVLSVPTHTLDPCSTADRF
jgi:hypothetical protein